MMMSRALVLRALAISTSCCLPIESVLTMVCGATSRPTIARYLRDSAIHRPLVDQAEADRLAAEKQIGGDREVIGQVELLVDQRDADVERLGDGRESHCLAVDEHLDRRRAIGRRRRFSSSVLLPAPFSPTTASTSPRSSVSETS